MESCFPCKILALLTTMPHNWPTRIKKLYWPWNENIKSVNKKTFLNGEFNLGSVFLWFGSVGGLERVTQMSPYTIHSALRFTRALWEFYKVFGTQKDRRREGVVWWVSRFLRALTSPACGAKMSAWLPDTEFIKNLSTHTEALQPWPRAAGLPTTSLPLNLSPSSTRYGWP